MDAQAPPQSPGQTGTTAYNEGGDGAGRTLNLFKEFDSFLGNPFSTFVASEVDGEVVCHAVNLLNPGNMFYRVGDPVGNQSFVAKSYGSHSTSIGNITWGKDLETNGLSLSYVPCSEDQLRQHHKFFPSWPQKDPVDLMARYSLSVTLGTSHTELVWPPPSTPLLERIEFQYNKLLGEIPAKNRPVFLTGRWVEGGERIYRRAFGGEQVDEVFANVRANLNSNAPWFDEAVKRLEEGLKSPPPHVLYYCEKGFEQTKSSPYKYVSRSEDEVLSTLENTLLAYGDEPRGSWKHSLYMCRDHIQLMLWERRAYIVGDEQAIIVPLDSTAALRHRKSLQLK